MRILFVPVFNYPNNLNADSIYLISGDWCRALCEADENISIYRLLPEPNNLEDKFKKFIYRYEPVHQRVHDIFVPMYSRYDMEEVNCPIDTFKRFHPVLGEFPVDAVITTSAIKTVFVKRILLVGGGETYHLRSSISNCSCEAIIRMKSRKYPMMSLCFRVREKRWDIIYWKARCVEGWLLQQRSHSWLPR